MTEYVPPQDAVAAHKAAVVCMTKQRDLIDRQQDMIAVQQEQLDALRRSRRDLRKRLKAISVP